MRRTRILQNGIIFKDSPYDDGEVKVILKNHGSMMDKVYDLPGIQHVREHTTITFYSDEVFYNASTSPTNMDLYFMMKTGVPFSVGLTYLKECLPQDKDGYMYLCPSPGLSTTKNTITEVGHEYNFRASAFEIAQPFYFMLMDKRTFSPCGSPKLLPADKINSALVQKYYVPTTDVMVLYDKRYLTNQQVVELYRHFSSYTKLEGLKIPRDMIRFRLKPFVGKHYTTNTTMCTVTFEVDPQLTLSAINYLLFARNAFVYNHPLYDRLFITLAYTRIIELQRALYALKHKLYDDLRQGYYCAKYVFEELLFYNHDINVFDKYEMERNGRILSTALLKALCVEYEHGRYVTSSPMSEFLPHLKTINGEPYQEIDAYLEAENFMYERPITFYDFFPDGDDDDFYARHGRDSEMYIKRGSNCFGAVITPCLSTSPRPCPSMLSNMSWPTPCFSPVHNSFELQEHHYLNRNSFGEACPISARNMSGSISSSVITLHRRENLLSTIQYIVRYVVNKLHSRELDHVDPMGRLKGHTEDRLTLLFSGEQLNIKTFFSFCLFLVVLPNTEPSTHQFEHDLRHYICAEKKKGNIYYYDRLVYKLANLKLMVIYSNPDQKDNWSTSMINFFTSSNTTNYVYINSDKSHVYDFSQLKVEHHTKFLTSAPQETS